MEDLSVEKIEVDETTSSSFFVTSLSTEKEDSTDQSQVVEEESKKNDHEEKQANQEMGQEKQDEPRPRSVEDNVKEKQVEKEKRSSSQNSQKHQEHETHEHTHLDFFHKAPKEKKKYESWLLGTRYYPLPEKIIAEEEISNSDEPEEVEVQEFLTDFQSKLWFSYRRNFHSIGSSALTSDSGWGCMLRSGQMLLGSALIRHFLGPTWRLDQVDATSENWMKYKMILSWFLDKNEDAPYSLSNFAKKGEKYDITVGQWHGPTTTAQIIKSAVNRHCPGGMKAYISQDATVYKNEIAKLCKKAENPSEWHPVLILLPIRLGIEFNPAYLPSVIETFKFPQSLGFAGGKIGMSFTSTITLGKWRNSRATRSMYFVGVDDHKGIYFLDPHKTQNSLDLEGLIDATPEYFQSYHYRQNPKRTTTDNIDPSALFGFYCKDKHDFYDFCERLEKMCKEKKPSPFCLAKKKPVYYDNVEIEEPEQSPQIKWVGPKEWFTPASADKSDFLRNSDANPRPSPISFEVKELVTYRSSNGSVKGVLMVSGNRVFFEPLRQDPMTQKYGAETYRWGLSSSSLESCKHIVEREEEDHNSTDFVIVTQRRRLSLSSNGSDNEIEAPSASQALNTSYQNIHLSKMLHALDIRSIIFEELKLSVDEIYSHFDGVEKIHLSPIVHRLIDAVELLFNYGLKTRSGLSIISSHLIDLAQGKTNNVHVQTAWPVIESIACKDHLSLIGSYPDLSELEKMRLWFATTLNEGSLLSYIQIVNSDTSIANEFYSQKAAILDLPAVKNSFQNLSKILFALSPEKGQLIYEKEEGTSEISLAFNSGGERQCINIIVPSEKLSKIIDPISSMVKIAHKRSENVVV